MSNTNGKPKPKREIPDGSPFIMIPYDILGDRQLSGSAKLLFGLIYSLSQTARGCYATNEGLARRCGISIRQFARILPELEARGLIRRRATKDGHGRAMIEVMWKGGKVRTSDKMSGQNVQTPPSAKTADPPSAKTADPLCKNGRPSRTMKHCARSNKVTEQTLRGEKEGPTDLPFSPSGGETPPTDPDGSSSSRHEKAGDAVCYDWRALAGIGPAPQRKVPVGLADVPLEVRVNDPAMRRIIEEELRHRTAAMAGEGEHVGPDDDQRQQ